MLTRVICGFQTGADQAGARAARTLGYRTGGLMPKGWKTEDGPRPEFAELYGALESNHAGYEHRTRWNIQRSDGTVILTLGAQLDGGSALTRSICEALGIPYLHVGLPPRGGEMNLELYRHTVLFLSGLTIANIAGNRESKAPGIGALAEAFLLDVLTWCRQTQASPTSLST